MDQPIIAQVILEQRVPINILSAHFNQQESRILVEIPASNAEKVAESFRGRGVEVFSRELVRVDNELCFECGACVSLCPVNAITFKEDYT
jgi:NAD-dependent dihydropyrimidine dehydrogenase PreA subunit